MRPFMSDGPALLLGKPSEALLNVVRAAAHGMDPLAGKTASRTAAGGPTATAAPPSQPVRQAPSASAIYATRREQTLQPVAKPAAETIDWAAIVAEQNAKLPAGAIIPGASRSKAIDPAAIYGARRAQTEAAPQSAVPAGLMAEAVAKLNAGGQRASAGFRTAYETYAARRAQTGDE